MTTYLLHDDALRSPEMRHEIGEPIADAITFIEHEGRRIVVGGVLEQPIFDKREDIVDEFWPADRLGWQQLITDTSLPAELIEPELVLRAVTALDTDSVVVPGSFPTIVSDYLRGHGIDVAVDEKAWARRRRRKAPWELEGSERAQRAAEVAMLTAARMLREAEGTAAGELRFEGEILTAELIREAMKNELLTQGAECEQIIVQSGDACLNGHEIGSGPILPDRSCIIDCFPRDRRSGAHSDMTRTFVPGRPSEELKQMHADCRRALEIALESMRPGRADAYDGVCDYLEERGYPTQRSNARNESLTQGFFHALGHGVGLQLHESPKIGRRAEELTEGDVVAIEPGLYFPDVGGVRLEDTVVVTEAGPEHFTEPYPYDLAP